MKIIAEFKRRSPFIPNHIFTQYPIEDVVKYYDQVLQASEISVVVDELWGGSYDDIERARSVTNVPILAKSLKIDPDLAAERGASAVLSYGSIWQFINTYLEVHTMADIVAAKLRGDNPAAYVINNRNLGTGEVDLGIASRLVASISEHNRVIAASGYRKVAQVPRGCDSVLMGEQKILDANNWLKMNRNELY